MEQTEFNVEVVCLKGIQKHPNADSLSIVEVNGFPVVFRTTEFREGSKAVYVPVDAMVPLDDPRFTFLGRHSRIKAAKLRGIFSMGLLVSCDQSWKVGQNVQEEMRITKYLSKADLQEQKAAGQKRPRKQFKVMPEYGLFSGRRYEQLMADQLKDRVVVVTEKIHGCNARYVFHKGKLHVGSHRSYRGSAPGSFARFFESVWAGLKGWFGQRDSRHIEEDDLWWAIAKKYDLETKLKNIPNVVVYGEIYGKGVQDLTYDAPNDQKFLVFDMYDIRTKKFLDYDQLIVGCKYLGLQRVPTCAVATFHGGLLTLKDGESILNPAQIREGCVIRPFKEFEVFGLGRPSFKLVSEAYLLRKEQEEKEHGGQKEEFKKPKAIRSDHQTHV
jgi:RNA ligase (TIGR02306 family)